MFTNAIIAVSALAAAVSAQGVTAKITPTAPAPAGCSANAGTFNIAVVNATTAGSKSKRQEAQVLTITLKDGVLTDNKNRTGYIAANQQFQFDAPAQTGAIYTAGFSACPNGTLALGGSAIWYQCLSGQFYNLYDTNVAAQCQQIFIDILPVSGGAQSSASVLTQIGDGQAQGPTSVNTVPKASQITDGQIQATTAASSLATTSAPKVSQITDGQIQATTPASSLATTSSVAKVSQITDGQIQATTPAASLATTKASTTVKTLPLVSQITDGQIQATTAATVAAYTGAAAMPTAAAGLLAAVAGAAVYML